MSSPQLEENQRNAIGALFQTIEINPVNLFKMKESIPDGYITKIFVNKAFEGISPKDLTTTVIKDCVESMKTDACIEAMVAQVILSCDLIVVADEEKIKNTHGYFIQACSQLKKNLKPKMNLLFREILALPSKSLVSSPCVNRLLEYMHWLLYKTHLPPFIQPVFVNFTSALLYPWSEHRCEDLAILIKVAARLIAREKEGAAGLIHNISFIFDRVFGLGEEEEAQTEPRRESNREIRADDERDKLESVLLDPSKRAKDHNLRFGYVSKTILPSLIEVLRVYFYEIKAEHESFNITPLFDLIKKIKALTVEQVAYCDELNKLRSKIQILLIDLISVLMEVVRGCFYDIYAIFIEDFKWKLENLGPSSAFFKLLIKHFLLFPKSFHCSIIFEEPNVLFLLPKLIVWSEKSSRDSETSVKQLKKQVQTKLFEDKKQFDWVDSLTRNALPEAIVEYRKQMMRYLIHAMRNPSVVRLLSPEQIARLNVFLSSEMIPLQKLVVSLDETEAQLFRDCCYSISEVSLNAGGSSIWDYKTIEDAWAFANNWTLLKGNSHAFDQTFGRMENWVRRVGQGYRNQERDVLLGKREEVDRYIVNLIQETKSKVTKRLLREGALEQLEEDHQTEGDKHSSNGHTNEEKDDLFPQATRFTSNFSAFDSKDHQTHEEGFSNNVRLENPFEHNLEPSSLRLDNQQNHSLATQHSLTTARQTFSSHLNNNDSWKLKGAHPTTEQETLHSKQLLPLESDSEEPIPPKDEPKSKAAVQAAGPGEEETPASPVPSIAFSDLEHAPAFIL